MNNVDKETLSQKYMAEKKPISVVAGEMGVSVGTVHNYLKKYGIKTRRAADYPVTNKQREASRRTGKKSKGRKASHETRQKISEARKQNGIGHKKLRADGYIAIYFPDHPKSSADGYIMEHILVMEALIGRHLSADECVHHIDGDKKNNKKGNLKLMTKKEHMSYHMKERHKGRGNVPSIQ